eukprot:768310-Pyramimonas_sp.AAC.1
MVAERPHHVLLAVENLDTATLRRHIDTLQLERAAEGAHKAARRLSFLRTALTALNEVLSKAFFSLSSSAADRASKCTCCP